MEGLNKNNLRQILFDRGMFQKELATTAGISLVSINRYILGYREPKVSDARKIADALGVQIEDIWERGDENERI